MFPYQRILIAGMGFSLFLLSSARGQDFFTNTIPTSSLSIGVEEFAVIPDSSTNNPARVSVLTPDPSGRLFANDQRGPLYNISANGEEVTEYLDLRDFPGLDIVAGSEPGFQSFAFHPDFATPDSVGYGRFYTIHSSDNTASAPDFDPGGSTSFHSLLLEWQTSDPSSTTYVAANAQQPFREVMRLKQPFGNHNTGLIAFNPAAGQSDSDYGNLYVAVGDGGSGGDPQDNGQDPSNPFGALLRIDPLGNDSANGQYGIVTENLLASDGTPSTLGEIYAYGLRNPQRFGWDTTTGDFYIADIGQNAVEEINLGQNGADYGWDNREGSFAFESTNSVGFVDPVAEYDHTNFVSDPPTTIGNRAVTVGEVARGTGFPNFDGQLLFGDFPTGLIFMFDVDSDPLDGGQDGLVELRLRNDEGDAVRLLELINEVRADRGLSLQSRADLRFGINTPGEVYITNKRDGVIRRLVFDLTPGDATGDGVVDADDLNAWLTHNGTAGEADRSQGDFDGDFDVDGADYLLWQRQFTGALGTSSIGVVPEPHSLGLLAIWALTSLGHGRVDHRRREA